MKILRTLIIFSLFFSPLYASKSYRRTVRQEPEISKVDRIYAEFLMAKAKGERTDARINKIMISCLSLVAATIFFDVVKINPLPFLAKVLTQRHL
jgi:hypothetical protein